MTHCPWERIDDFASRAEFDRFVAWMSAQVDAGSATEVPVTMRYLESTTLIERWYRHSESGQTWRVVWPDPPFRGLFSPL